MFPPFQESLLTSRDLKSRADLTKTYSKAFLILHLFSSDVSCFFFSIIVYIQFSTNSGWVGEFKAVFSLPGVF